jgi:predicted class III extradiol MEMO1 family dioxygenase
MGLSEQDERAPARDGFTVPTRYWHALDDGRIQCDVCPRACKLREGQRGVCFVRARLDDQVVLTSYVCLGDVAVLPLAVGQVAATDVANVLEQVWGGAETLVVVSTDLSHYHDYATATELDRRTAAEIVSTRPERLGVYDACGVLGVKGLLIAADRHGLDVELLDLRTSADTAGDPERVVGYGAFALA